MLETIFGHGIFLNFNLIVQAKSTLGSVCFHVLSFNIIMSYSLTKFRHTSGYPRCLKLGPLVHFKNSPIVNFPLAQTVWLKWGNGVLNIIPHVILKSHILGRSQAKHLLNTKTKFFKGGKTFWKVCFPWYSYLDLNPLGACSSGNDLSYTRQCYYCVTMYFILISINVYISTFVAFQSIYIGIFRKLLTK